VPKTGEPIEAKESAIHLIPLRYSSMLWFLSSKWANKIHSGPWHELH